jgi:uncharacterized SAM-binding protein YcdF (DUF218 family)
MKRRTLSLLVLALALVIGALGSFAWELAQFDAVSPPSDADVRRASAAVVFSGDFARIDEALKLLAAGRVRKVYISGFNAGAGLIKQKFVTQFSRRNPEIARLDKLVACCVEMGEAADSTIQNAMETQCWLTRRSIEGPILLVTSRMHMARALALLSRTAPDRDIIPFPVADDTSLSDSERSEEYDKFVQTLMLVRVPGLLRLESFSGPFAAGCPTEP